MHQDDWTVERWVEYVSARPELFEIARKVELPPERVVVISFRYALAASRVKREMDSAAHFLLPSERVVREILGAFGRGGSVIELRTRRIVHVTRAAGLELDAVHLSSLPPPKP